MDTTDSSAHAHPTTDEDPCFVCYDGWVYLGHLLLDEETGEDVEVVERVPCRRCNGMGQIAH